MYTVIRFVANTEMMAELSELGRAMNERRPGSFAGLSKNNTRFSCDISKESNWRAHHHAIAAFVSDFSDLIRAAKQRGVDVFVDTAIEPEDKESMVAYVGLGFAPDLLSTLGAAGVQLDVTCY